MKKKPAKGSEDKAEGARDVVERDLGRKPETDKNQPGPDRTPRWMPGRRGDLNEQDEPGTGGKPKKHV